MNGCTVIDEPVCYFAYVAIKRAKAKSAFALSVMRTNAIKHSIRSLLSLYLLITSYSLLYTPPKSGYHLGTKQEILLLIKSTSICRKT